MTESSDINVICMKWGTAYSADQDLLEAHAANALDQG